MVSASGGARMQEGPLSLMQLAKTAQEIGKLREHGVLTVNVNTDPTYGGTTASYAMLGDIIVAEPGARIGFAGPEVIKNTIKRTPPEGFQNAESLYQNGLIDLVVPRAELRDTLAGVLAVHATTDAPVAPAGSAGYQTDPAALSARDPVAVVAGARDIGRPNTLDYCSGVFDAFLELHGDRLGTDDLSVVGGIGSLAGRPMMVLGHQKGHDSAELVRRNFGMARPAGYRKALRLMDYAERHGMPLVTFVDTPGAYPDVEAERYGQGTAIAECVLAMSRLRVPTIVVVTGEGGSGGALALGVGNRFLMCSGAYFSVISPEGAATILFGGTEHAPRMATALHITASDLLRLGIADGVLLEPEGGAAKDPSGMFAVVRAALRTSVAELVTCSPEQIVLDRYHKMCRFGDPDNQADLIERMATR
jgi:acetyl-CoA carboxylase carboxyl transferase subunit beta